MSAMVPGPPQIYPRPAATDNQLEFWWESPILQPGDPDISSYQLACSSIEYVADFSRSTFATRVPNLINNQYYQFTIAAANEYGLGTPAAYRNVQAGLKATKNSVIRATMLTSTTANIQWTFTQNPAEATNLGFAVLAIPSTPTASTLTYSAVGANRSRIIKDLEYETYKIKVYAVNDAGWQRLNTTNAITLNTQIFSQQPTRAKNVFISRISWSSFFAEYTPGLNASNTTFLLNNLLATPAAQIDSIAPNQATARFDNLTGLTQYAFSVVTNNNLASVSTPQVLVKTLIPPPTPIVNFSVTDGTPSSFTVNWTGGVHTSSYVYTFDGIPRDSNASTNTSASFSSLTVATFYSIIVSGTNISGQAISEPYLVTTTPYRPTDVYVTDPRPVGFTVHWTPGSPGATYYKISVDGGLTYPYNPVTSPHTITDLDRGITYQVVVAAGNSSGFVPSEPPVPAKTGPSPPTNLQVTSPTLNSFTINWTAGVAATSYNVSLDNGATFIANTTNLTYTFTSLSAGTTYQVVIQSQDDFLVTTNSATFPAVTYPVAPANVATSSVTQTGFVVNWTASYGATSYSININDTGYVLVSNDPAVTTYTVTDMTAGSTPSIIVLASLVQPSNSEILSSAANQITQLLKPATPINLQASDILSTSFTLSWTASLGAQTYYLSLDNGVTYPFTAAATANPTYNFTSLQTGTTVQVVVKASNATGEAPSATYAVLTTPAAPINITTTIVSQTGFTVNWTPSVGAASYSIDVNGGGYIALADVNTYVVTGLDEGSTNSILLKANNASGSTEAASTNFQTKPSSPSAPTVTAATPTTIDISWTGGNGAGGYIFLVNGIEVTANPLNIATVPRTGTLTGLLPGTTYDIVIIATNTGGSSPSATAFSGIVLWLDALDPGATLTNGQTLTTWYDKSGYNNDATPSGAVTYQANAINETYPAMSLTGSQALTGNISIKTNQLTIFAVYVMNNISDANARLTSLGQTGQDDSTNNGYLAFTRQVQGFTPNRNGTQTAANYPANYSTAYLIETWFDGINAYATVQNGPTTGILQTPSTGPFTIDKYSLGAALTSGAVTGTYLHGNLAEVIIYDTAVTPEDRLNIEGYLSWKWGLENNLPETNPNAPTATPPATAGPIFGTVLTTPPAAPTNVNITDSGPQGFTVNWTSHPSATSYDITVTDPNGNVTTITGVTSPNVITGLTVGLSYQVVVIAVSGPRSTAAAPVIGRTGPGPATNLAIINPTTTSFTITWTAGTGAVGYSISKDNGSIFTTIGNVTTYTFTSLTAGTTYQIVVKSVDNNGIDTDSSPFSAPTLTAPPNPTSSSVTTTGYTVNWSSVTGAVSYNININGSGYVLVAGAETASSYTVTGLTAGSSHTVLVQATNSRGFSNASSQLTVVTTPPAPTNFQTTAVLHNSIAVSWTAATGATAYYLSSDGGSTYPFSTGSTTFIYNSSISGATTYSLMVKAYNATGGYSTPTAALSVLTRPSPVTNLAASSITATGCVVTWTTVTGATSYNIKVGTGSYQLVPGGETATTYTVTGLSPGTSTVITVQSTNASGSTEATVSVLTLPAAPADLTSSNVTSTSFTLTWTAVTGATAYYISTDNGATYPTTTSNPTYDFTGLSGGTTYNIYVKAYNSTGYSSPSAQFIFATAPNPPENLTASNVTSTSFSLSWSASTGASAYKLTINGGPEQYLAVRTYNATGLSPGSTNSVSVVATGANGDSTASTLSVLTLPAQVTNVQVSSITSTTFYVSWSAITADYYQVSADNGASYTTSYSNNITLTNLTPRTNYRVIVIATNARGNGQASSPSVNITTTGPSAPSNLTSSDIGLTSFTLSWTQSDGTSGITYSFTLNDLTPASIGATVSQSGTTAIFSDLTYYTNYYIIITATDTLSRSSPSSVFLVTTLIPPPPTMPILSISNNASTSFTVSWTGGDGATSYTYNVNGSGATPTINNGLSAKNATFSGSSGNTYTVEVIASNVGGSTSSGNGQLRLVKNGRAAKVACSSSGQVIVALVDTVIPQFITISTNYGLSWTNVTINGSSGYLDGIACSADGTKIVTGDRSLGYIFTSADTGATWVQQIGSGRGQWYNFAMSSDGTYIYAAYGSHLTYTYSNPTVLVSNDSGVSWALIGPPDGGNNGFWTPGYYSGISGGKSIACNSTGRVLVSSCGGYVVTSENYGATWTPRKLHPTSSSEIWSYFNCDGVGGFQGAVDNAGKVWTNQDGAGWQITVPTPFQDAKFARTAFSSINGIIFTGMDNRTVYPFLNTTLYISTNRGVSWTPIDAGFNDKWVYFESNYDGIKIVALGVNNIYVFHRGTSISL